jgi:hypothetical protein
MIDPSVFNALRQLRGGVCRRFGSCRDALFELLDAAIVAGLVPSLAHLSLTAIHRRGGVAVNAHDRRLWLYDSGRPDGPGRGG